MLQMPGCNKYAGGNKYARLQQVRAGGCGYSIFKPACMWLLPSGVL
jgi:hypothetical protein